MEMGYGWHEMLKASSLTETKKAKNKFHEFNLLILNCLTNRKTIISNHNIKNSFNLLISLFLSAHFPSTPHTHADGYGGEGMLSVRPKMRPQNQIVTHEFSHLTFCMVGTIQHNWIPRRESAKGIQKKNQINSNPSL